jgi:hypothetical protein
MANLTPIDLEKPMCKHHKPIDLPYREWHEEVEHRISKGERQTFCPNCNHWLFQDELNEPTT